MELSQDLLSLEEQAGSSRDVMVERKEENALLEDQVRLGGLSDIGAGRLETTGRLKHDAFMMDHGFDCNEPDWAV